MKPMLKALITINAVATPSHDIDADLAGYLPDLRNMTATEIAELVEEAHTEALGLNAAFDTSFHRRAANWGAMDWMSREIELDKAYDLAMAYHLIRNQAIRDEAYPLKKPVEFRNRQYIWDEIYNDVYKAARIDVAHAAALEMDITLHRRS